MPNYAMNKIFDRCPFCNQPTIETETNEDKFEVYAFFSECDEILDINDYIPDWELHGYLERGYRVFIPRQRTKKDTKMDHTLYQIVIEGEEPIIVEKKHVVSHFESAYNSDASQWVFKVEPYGIQLRLNATRKMTTLPENQKYEESPGIYMPWVMTGRNHGYLVIAEEVIDEKDDEIDYK